MKKIVFVATKKISSESDERSIFTSFNMVLKCCFYLEDFESSLSLVLSGDKPKRRTSIPNLKFLV